MEKQIKIHNVEQGSDEWLKLREGVITASVVKDLATPTWKFADNLTSRKALYRIACERINGFAEPSFATFDMQRGHIEEPLARDLYNVDKKDKATEVGFITLTTKGITIGYSPDGIVGDKGLIEIKSAKAVIQFERLLSNEAPAEHMAQMYMGMLVTGREWCDFISYSNGMPMHVVRVPQNLDIQEKMLNICFEAEARIAELIRAFKFKTKDLKKAEKLDYYQNEINL